MREVFYEEASFINDKRSASRKYNTYRIISIFSISLSFVVFFAVYMVVQNLIYTILHCLLPMAALIAAGIILGRIKNRFYVEYDYTFVTGSVRFAKVIKEIKRVRVAMFDTSSILKIGRTESLSFSQYKDMPEVKICELHANDEPSENCEFFYIYTIFEGNKTVFIIDCTEKFIAHIMQFANKGIFELDKWFILTTLQRLGQAKML